jgi:vesicle transport protein SEC22
LIVEKVIYMCICDSSYPRKLAFSYLDELSKEFQRSYGDKIESVTRPYAFMGFGRSPLPLFLALNRKREEKEG